MPSIYPADNRPFVIPAAVSTWPSASQLAKIYTYKGAVGQLVHVRNDDELAFLRSLFPSEKQVLTSPFVWLAAAENNFSDGIYFSSYPMIGQKFFNATSALPGFYANFDIDQPGNISGGLGLAMSVATGKWFVDKKNAV